jgi:hypothetical protein
MGIAEVLTIIFVCAKIFGAITWSWVWVFCPLWIVYGLILAALVVAGVIVGLYILIKTIVRR